MREFFSSTTGKIITAAVGILLVIAIILLATSGAGASSTTRGIGLEQSINVALADAGLSRDQVSGLQGHFDKDDGPDAYEVSFYANSCEYEYTINASDGDILECKIESPEGQRVTAEQARDLEKDQEPAKSASNTSSDYIGTDKAKSIALQDAGIESSDATFTAAKLDREDGRYVYEIDFYTADREFDYEIDATTGQILGRDSEPLDDWDDDDRYDD